MRVGIRVGVGGFQWPLFIRALIWACTSCSVLSKPTWVYPDFSNGPPKCNVTMSPLSSVCKCRRWASLYITFFTCFSAGDNTGTHLMFPLDLLIASTNWRLAARPGVSSTSRVSSYPVFMRVHPCSSVAFVRNCALTAWNHLSLSPL